VYSLTGYGGRYGMADTTTIEITDAQNDELERLKAVGQSKKGILQDLIDNYTQSRETLDEARVREIAREEIRDNVVPKAQDKP